MNTGNGGLSKLSYGQIEGVSASLRNKATSMESILNEIDSLFDQVGNDETWGGTAASDAKMEFDALAAKFSGFSLSVNTCADALDNAVANYTQVDAAVKGAI